MERRDFLHGRWRFASAVLLVLTGTSGAHAEPGDAAALDEPFVEHFEPYDAAPESYEVEDGAVDIAQFDPPLEEPAPDVLRDLGQGTASYYGRRFHGRRTANGERFDMHALTAAHRTLPFGSMVRVTNPTNGRSIVVRINDRGPFIRGRVIDVSRAAAQELGLIGPGHATVELELLAP